MATTYQVNDTPTQIIIEQQNDGALLTNTGQNIIYISDDSGVNSQSQIIDIGGSINVIPGSDVWAIVNDVNNGSLLVTRNADFRYSQNAAPITYLGSVNNTANGSATYNFNQTGGVSSQFKAYKIVMRVTDRAFTTTNAGDYLWTFGANLNLYEFGINAGLSTETQNVQSTFYISNKSEPVPNVSYASLVIPVNNALSGQLFISPPTNTMTSGTWVMDVYGLTDSPGQLVPWEDPTVTKLPINSVSWVALGDSWLWRSTAAAVAPSAVPLPNMPAPFRIAVIWTQADTTSRIVTVQYYYGATATTPYSNIQQYDSTLVQGGAAAGTYAGSKEYSTTPNTPLTILTTALTSTTNIAILVSRNVN